MKSLCVSGRELSSRPEFSWEMSLSLRVLCCGLHFCFFAVGRTFKMEIRNPVYSVKISLLLFQC